MLGNDTNPVVKLKSNIKLGTEWLGLAVIDLQSPSPKSKQKINPPPTVDSLSVYFNERPQTSADIFPCKNRAACGPTTISLPCALWLSTLMERFKNVVPHSNFLALLGYNHIRNVDIVLWSVFTWIKVPRFCCPEMFFIIYVLYLLIALYLW